MPPPRSSWETRQKRKIERRMRNHSDLYRLLYRIRRFEETVLENFAKGVFRGTTHAYLGQEANAVGVLSQLEADDIVFSNHRCHGHFLAYGGQACALFAEMMGKSSGVCGGRGGSQHLQWRNFYSNGVQGGILPLAVGAALAEKEAGCIAIVVCFLGDGTLGEGLVYESLNLASLWRAPVLFVVENNRIAQTTPVETALAGQIEARFAAFGIPSRVINSSDVIEIMEAAGRMVTEVRNSGTPYAVILETCRFGPHSKGDDTRPEGEVAAMKANRDPLAIQAQHLTPRQRTDIEAEIDAEIEAAFQAALAEPFPESVATGTALGMQAPAPVDARGAGEASGQEQPPQQTVLQALNRGLHQAMADDPQVVLLGEDILDPYGGAFKVTQGISSAFPGRVLASPISEAGLVGVANGMALRGLRPVVEIMFGDFLTLAADQLINHAAKFRWMYNEQVRVPIVVRTPMGGRRGYGPTHSQTLEKHFLGVPGLFVLAPTALGDPGDLLRQAIRLDDPVLFVENKLLYLSRLHDQADLAEFDLQRLESPGSAPVYRLAVRGAPDPVLTLAAYGYMAELARQAVLMLAYEREIFVDLVVITQLAPMDLDVLIKSVGRTGRVLALEEGGLTLGWGAEVLARVVEALGGQLRAAGRVAALDLPVPASEPLESAVLPGVAQIVARVEALLKEG